MHYQVHEAMLLVALLAHCAALVGRVDGASFERDAFLCLFSRVLGRLCVCVCVCVMRTQLRNMYIVHRLADDASPTKASRAKARIKAKKSKGKAEDKRNSKNKKSKKSKKDKHPMSPAKGNYPGGGCWLIQGVTAWLTQGVAACLTRQTPID